MGMRPFSALALASTLTMPVAEIVSQEGLTLAAPLNSTETYLVDRDGNVAHQWSSDYLPGLAAEIDSQGRLWRAIDPGNNQWSGRPGSGGGIERFAWDGSLEWQAFISDNTWLQHHDIEVLPNGNVLAIVWENRTVAEAVAAGRDAAITTDGIFAPDMIVEIRPEGPDGGTVVWEWRVWDHLIQDTDQAKPNFGTISDHPELIDINYPPKNARAGDWTHFNSVDYDPVNDLILISCKHFDEVWVIDHATTKAEAAGAKGDLLYRWGNPAAYQRGSAAEQQLFGQHDAQWIAAGLPGAGDILVFNNGQQRPAGNWSSVEQFSPPVDANGSFTNPGAGAWGPQAPNWSWADGSFFSALAGGCQRLANGNTFITDSGHGRVFEVDHAGSVVWFWDNPFPNQTDNTLFRSSNEDRMLWPGNTALSLAGGLLKFEVIAGAHHANQRYAMTGGINGLPMTQFKLWYSLDQHGRGLHNLLVPPLSSALLGRTARLFAFTASRPRIYSKELTVKFIP
ncbi:MAG: arylsulfotransferase [Planctomycetota bacterium]|nr:MAG: arylsulfotransferase [Planctomycetota bacterium]